MHANADDLPIVFEAGPAHIRATDWGGLRALLISLPTGTDAAPLLRGLPDNRCQCPHWGYVRKGQLQVAFADHTETFSEGDLYYMPSGHTLVVERDAELVEFSPPDQYDEVLDAMRSNVASAAG